MVFRRLRVLSWLAVIAIATSACAGTEAAAPAAAVGGATTSVDPKPAPSPSPTSAAPPPTTAPPTTAPPTTSTAPTALPPTALPTTTALPTSALPADCRTIEDFDDEDAAARWRVVNDGVMGGRSAGNAEVADGVLRFSGTIVTDGGGFSLVRVNLGQEPLAGVSELRVRARSDGRTYELIAEDSLAGRNRSVSHFGALAFVGEDAAEWETLVVRFAGMEPRAFGNPVDSAEPFQPDLVTSIGIIQSDGSDGAFAIEIDRIDACP